MGTLRDFTPGQDPAQPVPAAGSDAAHRLSALLVHNPWFTLLNMAWVRGWNSRVGDTGQTPGWVIPASLN